jgi:hypothetical protein
MLTKEILTRGFTARDKRFTLRAKQNELAVVLYLGSVDQAGVPHFRPEGALAALGFHQIPTWQLPEEERKDCLRYRYMLACVGSDELALEAGAAVDAELGPVPDSLLGQAFIDAMNQRTDLAIVKLAELREKAHADGV